MKNISKLILIALFCTLGITSYAQQPESVYGDKVKADVKMKYVYSLEEAFDLSMQTKKPIFVNCFADWAMPCHGMNMYVFCNQEFADYMDQNFVNLFLDMTTETGKDFGKRYSVDSYAHYLILNSEGEILLRISGGSALPEFQETVALALNPATNLIGATKAYNEGKRDKETLRNYLKVLELSYDIETYRTIDSAYIKALTPEEYCKKENWRPFTTLINDYQNEYFKYLTNHKADFCKEVGADKVEQLISNVMAYEIFPYTTGDEKYDAMKMLDIYREMRRLELPDSLTIWQFYNIGKLRGEKKTAELYAYLKEHRKQLERYAIIIDESLNKGLESEEQQLLVDYLTETMNNETYASNKRRLQETINMLTQTEGIKFEQGITFEQALAKAEKEGKMVFVDCYTTWCGPCKMMSRDVFTLKEVGDYFNPRFVSIKINMETNEGRELAKRYPVRAYPTMLVLDSKGNQLQNIVGACSGTDLINHTQGK